MSNRVWLISGCSRGFGYCLAKEVLAKGDYLMATARDKSNLLNLVSKFKDRCCIQSLDVTNLEQIKKVCEKTFNHFGKIDVLVNNAGYGLVGALEEIEEEQIRNNYETNFFGALHLIQQVLPFMRKKKKGHIFNISSIVGYDNKAGFSIYGSSKFALEGLSEALFEELKDLGIKVTIIEPGPFRTDFSSRSLQRAKFKIDDYNKSSGKTNDFISINSGKEPGNPVKAAKAIIQLADSDNPPLRIPFGNYALKQMQRKLKLVNKDLEYWKNLIKNMDFNI